MGIIHHMTLRARHGQSQRLGRCLSALRLIMVSEQGCKALSICGSRDQPLIWQVRSGWHSASALDAFLVSEALRRVLAQAIGEDLLASLDCNVESLQQVA